MKRAGRGPSALDGPSDAAWSGVDDGARADELSDDGAPALAFDIEVGARYQRGHLLGEGGMGRVTQVFDRRLGREVAMKEVRAMSPAQTLRFAREAAITARLDHPGIVSVHDAGRGDDGTLYYTMRIVRGRSLAVAIADAGTLDARLRLLRHGLDACQAVAFAHRHGVVHRDIKPANVMIGELGETQVLDWGLARAVASAAHDLPAHDAASTRDDGDADLTRDGTIIGTPRYMSPEQAQGRAATPASDVWALGALLFELCCARPANDAPSETVLATARVGVSADPRTLEPDAPPELAAIILRATRHDPALRYPDAEALARDLALYMEGRRVSAHSYSTWELVRRVVRAWRVPLLAALAALVAIGVGLAIAFAEVDAERDRAVLAEASTRVALTQADRSLARMLATEAVTHATLDARPEAEILAAHAERIESTPSARAVLLRYALTPRSELIGEVALPTSCLDADVAIDLSELVCREQDGVSSWGMSGLRVTLRWRARAAHLLGVGHLADAVVATNDRRMLLAWDRASGRPRPTRDDVCCGPPRANAHADALAIVQNRQLTVVTAERVVAVLPCPSVEELAGAVDASGTTWATTCGDGSLRIGALDGTSEMHVTPLATPRGPATALAFTADGASLVLGASDGRVVRYDRVGGVRYDVDSGLAHIRQVVTSPDGRWAAVLGDRAAVRLLDVDSGTWRGRLPASDARSLRFVAGRDADLVLLGSRLSVWRLSAGMANVWSVADGVTALVPSPDGASLAVVRGKGVELRRVADGALLQAGTAYDAVTKGGAFTPDGRVFVASAGSSRRVTRWDTGGLERWASELEAPFAVRAVTVLERASGAWLWLALPSSNGVIVWPDGDTRGLVVGDELGGFIDLAGAHDQRSAWLIGADGLVAELPADAPIVAPRFDAPGARVLAVSRDGEALVLGYDHDVEERSRDGALVRVYAAPGSTLISLALSPDGRFLAAGDREGRAFVWERGDGRLVAAFKDHTRRVSALAFDPSSRWLATGSWDQTVRLAALDLPSTSAAALEQRWGITLESLLEE